MMPIFRIFSGFIFGSEDGNPARRAEILAVRARECKRESARESKKIHGVPAYLKMGLRNAPDLYPWGEHLRAVSVAMSRERVRRMSLVLDLVRRTFPEAVASAPGAAGLGVPATR